MKLLRLTVVLAAVDYDETSGDALQGARELAHSAAAKLHVVHVGPSDGRQTPHAAGEHQHDVARMLNRAGLKPDDVSVHLLAGDAPNEIRALGDRLRADVIVLGKHRGRSVDRRPIGSTALGVVTSSWAPCLILSGPMRLPLERVLVPLDLSDTSRGALVVALSWASAMRGAEKREGSRSGGSVALTALVVDSSARAGGRSSEQRPALETELDRLRRDAGTWANVSVAGEVLTSTDVPAAIAAYASEHESDLVVLGTRGLGLDDVGRLGSVSLGVAQRVAIPILLVPPAVWSSYATTA